MCATFYVISFSTIYVYIITCRTFTLNMIHVLSFVSFSYIMYLVLRHVGGSRDSGTGCALVGVSRYNFTNVYFCIMFLYLYRINKFLPPSSFLWPKHFSILFSRKVSTCFTCSPFLISSFLMWSNLVFPLVHINVLISA